jgi:tetratricopeptide (TPR) repeat protein
VARSSSERRAVQAKLAGARAELDRMAALEAEKSLEERARAEEQARLAEARSAQNASPLPAPAPPPDQTAPPARPPVSTGSLPAAPAPAPSAPPRPAGALWAARYDLAIDAITRGRWQQAIPLLEQAIAVDPTPQAKKRVNGTVSEDYFPQYYLFLAYLKTNQLERARTFYVLRGPLTPALARDAELYYQELLQAEAKRPK